MYKKRLAIRAITKILIIAFSYLFIFFCSLGLSAEGLEWERIRLMPALSLSKTYTDNIYLTSIDTRSDSITTVSPNISLDFAIAPHNIISARYDGDFRFYDKSDNFRDYVYQTGLSWTLTAPKGSTFKIDASSDSNSIQPYSAQDTHKDYVAREAFANIVLKSLPSTDIGFQYDHTSRTFDDERNAVDDFDRNTVTLDVTYWRLPLTGFLIEYTYSRQNNYNLPLFQMMDSQVVLAGIQSDSTAKLSGHLKAGYYSVKVNEGNNSDGFGMDTDLTYKISDFTQFTAAAFRRLLRSTMAARETGEFYVSAGGTLSASYSRWQPITMTADISYIRNKFSQQDFLPAQERTDNFFSAGLGIKYSPRDWFSFYVSCKYKVNDSNLAAYKYRENRIEAGLSFAI